MGLGTVVFLVEHLMLCSALLKELCLCAKDNAMKGSKVIDSTKQNYKNEFDFQSTVCVL